MADKSSKILWISTRGTSLPLYSSSSVENTYPNRVLVHFNKTVKITNATGCTIRIDGSSVSITSITGSGTSTLTFYIATSVVYGDLVDFQYNATIGNITNSSDVSISSITLKTVTNNVTWVLPVYISSSVENAYPSRVVVIFDKTVNIINATGITININSISTTIETISGSGTTTLTFNTTTSVLYGDNITFTYNNITGNITDIYSNKIASITSTTVTNNVEQVVPEEATYYIDYDNGIDTNNGTSASTPWKHCKGDTNATGVPASTTLQPGDIISFKGGVYYRGSITVPTSGTSGNTIQFRGDMWGTSSAILDGSKPLTGWTQCASASECGGNANYANIYYAYIPAADYIGISYCNLHENDTALYVAQYPNPTDRFYWNDTATLRTVPSPISNTTRTSITDTEIFTQSDDTYWNGSSIAIWYQPNLVKILPILSYNHLTSTITFADTNIYTDRATKYAIYNSIHEIDQAGEYYVNSTAEIDGTYKVYLWPNNPANLTSGISISTRKFGFDLTYRSYLVFKGFTIQKYTGSGLRDGIAIGTYQGGSSALTDITIEDNYIYHNCGPTGGGYGGFYLAGTSSNRLSNSVITGNTFYENTTQFGMFLSYADGYEISDNILNRSGYTDVVLFYCTTSTILRNTILDGRGSHANGLTIYLQCSQILVAWNKIYRNESPITFNENYGGIYFYRNLIDAHLSVSQYGVNEWGSGSSDYQASNIWFLNNTFVRSSTHNSCSIGTKPLNSYVTRNNIFDGGGDNSTHTVDRDYNLYVGLMWNQEPSYGWYANTSEIVDTDDDVFIDYTSDTPDLHLKTSSPAIGMGVNISSYLTTLESLFPGIDFMVDLDGVTISVDNLDAGAYIKV